MPNEKKPKPLPPKATAEVIEDHSVGANDAAPLEDVTVQEPDAELQVAEEFVPQGPAKPRRKEPEREEHDPGRPKKPNHVKGIAPGSTITY